jgi:hypothetical protein
MDATSITENKKTFTTNLLTYKASFASDAQVAATPVQMASGKGWLFVASQYIEPFVLEYDPVADTLSSLTINILVRDFDGVDDQLGNEDQPTALTKEHMYNLRNQGWVKPGPNGVLQGAGTTNPFTAPTGPSEDTPVYYSSRDGNLHTNIP